MATREGLKAVDMFDAIDRGEITDKGSINQRAVLKHRDGLVQAMHSGTAPNTLLTH